MVSVNPYFTSNHAGWFYPLSVLYMGAIHAVRWIAPQCFPPVATTTPLESSLSSPTSTPVAVVTGSNTGIGFETARTLVLEYGWDVILACRSKDKALQAMEQIQLEAQGNSKAGKAIVLDPVLDLSDFSSIDAFVRELRSKYSQIHALVNNAGRNTSGESVDGFDLLFQSNFLGHFRLTLALLPIVKKVVNLSSVMHHFSHAGVEKETYWKQVAAGPCELPTYAATKLAAILFSLELTRRYDIPSVAVNPGATASSIWRGFPESVQSIMKKLFLTPRQASVPVVEAILGSSRDQQTSFSKKPVYIQPYWLPTSYTRTPFPVPEMLGVYMGYAWTQPRLPTDGGREAGEAMWKVCAALAQTSKDEVVDMTK
eukprot:Nitzschia sp. Nitz4//scaffold47_size129522//45336//46445//NITZ4_003546-RA/size129522-processed-gene-0.10-mRNA-1//1//CDS//3329552785//1577//frame0